MSLHCNHRPVYRDGFLQGNVQHVSVSKFLHQTYIGVVVNGLHRLRFFSNSRRDYSSPRRDDLDTTQFQLSSGTSACVVKLKFHGSSFPRSILVTSSRAGASILGGFGRVISHIFLEWGVNWLAILTNFVSPRSSDSCVKSEVCFTLSDVGVDLPPTVGRG